MLEKIVDGQVSQSGCTVCAFNTDHYMEAVGKLNTKFEIVKSQRDRAKSEKILLKKRINYLTKRLKTDNQLQLTSSL